MMALDGGEDGLDFYRQICSEAAGHLNKNGLIMLEIGYNQGETVTSLLEATERFENIICLKDLARKDRIVVATLQGKKKK